MGRIISDISKRVMIVEGEEEVKRILSVVSRSDSNDIVETKKLADDVWEIEIIKRVGSFYNKASRRFNE